MFISASPSLADFIETLLGTDPSGDAHPASLDILKVYIANNGTHFKFILECKGRPSHQSLIFTLSGWIVKAMHSQTIA